MEKFIETHLKLLDLEREAEIEETRFPSVILYIALSVIGIVTSDFESSLPQTSPAPVDPASVFHYYYYCVYMSFFFLNI